MCIRDRDDAVGDFTSASCIKADEAGEKQKRRKNSLLFTCGWTYSEYYQPRNGTYYGVVFTGFLVKKEKGK